MTNESTPQTLHQWWDEFTFSSKELYLLNDSGELTLNPIGENKERVIATITTDNADIVMKALLDKFSEVEAKIKELKEEWEAADDKMKLAGKVERIGDYLSNANAVGDYTALISTVSEMEQVINKQVSENYEEKLKLVQEAESLTESEDWKTAAQAMRDFTDKWKAIGHTDKERNDSLWERLEAARTKFFDRKRDHQEDVNKEMLGNLDIKMEIVDNAEQLAASDDWKVATEAFKELMERWKNTGHTLHDKNEALWNRFIFAKNTFFDRKRQNFEQIQQEQEANYALKQVLVEKAEAMKDSENWNETSKAYAALMDEWKGIGRVPTEKSDEIWGRLNAAKDNFFNNRRQHFETVRVSLEDNLAMKQALVKRAESLQNSSHWHETTSEMNELMEEWKKTGPVPREHSKKIWEQFLAARKTFFERKDANREHRKQKNENRHNERKYNLEKLLKTLESELKEEQDRLEDFKEGVKNVTPGKKADELKAHLENLIRQTEQLIEGKRVKIENTQKQLDDYDAQNQSVKPSSDNKDEETS